MAAAWMMHPLRRKKNSALHAALWRVHIIRAHAEELRIRRTLTGAEVDTVISAAVTAKAMEDEKSNATRRGVRCVV